jgi:choline dehydrogenase-like flavoprotein
VKLDYAPDQEDLSRLVRGLKLIGRIFLEADALRVMPPTFRYLEFTSPEQLDELDEVVKDNTDIELHSSHPQGGNAISRDPKKGVVDSDLRVHGFENLYVCDASVFPSPLTVNPQLTVMALAEYAADGIE